MEFIETHQFEKVRESYFSDLEFHLLQLALIDRPDAGDRIVGTGGARKIRWATSGKGKSGGARVIYYWITKQDQILFLTAYSKSEAANISAATKKAIKKVIKGL